ncbi:hypothetical protein ACB087_04075 [Vibrio sp. VNB-15]
MANLEKKAGYWCVSTDDRKATICFDVATYCKGTHSLSLFRNLAFIGMMEVSPKEAAEIIETIDPLTNKILLTRSIK